MRFPWHLVLVCPTQFQLHAFHVGDSAVPIIHRINPSHGSILGGTRIHVSGENFHPSAVKSCVFWGNEASIISNVATDLIEIVQISQYVNSTEVVCLSAASKKAHDVHLLLYGDEELASLEGTLDARGETFHYHKDIKISSVIPEAAWTKGGSTINIIGGPFFNSTGLLCSFEGIQRPAKFLSTHQISCLTPSHSVGTHALEVSQNGQDFTRLGYPFRFYDAPRIDSIFPAYGPAKQAGTEVTVRGKNFVDSTSLWCRFESVVVPAVFISSSEVHCNSPPIKDTDHSWLLLPEQRHNTSEQLFPSSHAYPLYSGKLVSFELTNNGQDYTESGLMFLYQNDIKVLGVSHSRGPAKGGTPLFISGSNFVNSTTLSCRFGSQVSKAQFITRESILCFSTPIYGRSYRNSNKLKSIPILVSNNALDYSYAGDFVYTTSIPEGMYQAGIDERHMLTCPRGSYCIDMLESNFTLCSPGTYQPTAGQSRCFLCPIGYICSSFGMSAPIICPAGYVCDERGMTLAKPCPAGFICARGTATFDTECFNSNVLSSEALKSTTAFSNIGVCFDNSTEDFGLQSSEYPAEFWAERHLMPLDDDASIQPTRGKFCLEDSCLKLEDANNVEVYDEFFDYSATGIALKRPRACPPGLYCNAGTAIDVASPEAYSPKVCENGFHCPEGSSSPKGVGVCMPGFFCRFGVKTPCPAGTFCPDDNAFDPIPCEPGTFNFMIGQAECSTCPVGFYCPKHGLKDPMICPFGFVCSRRGLDMPNIRCPAGFYCQNGTQTSDPFRNDTTLRPYACTPGTYCLAGTGYNEVREGTTTQPDDSGGYAALYAQPCPSGFFCEAASISAKGSGPCPPGFICPKGTANPRPTPKGFFSEHIGTVEATACLPGFYAPTVENEQCYTCPPGTSCTVQGLWEAEECPPGTYRSTTEADGNGCVSCPQGTWSKNWQLREKGECTRCPTGVVCPLDGMTNPCSFSDLPTPFEPIVNYNGMPAFEYDFPREFMPPRYSMDECLALNSVSDEFFFGELIPPYIDILGRGPHFRSSDQISLKYQSEAKCYTNSQPNGSLIYQRMADYYGPQFDIQSGYPHQGYGTAALLNQMIASSPPPGYDFELRYGYFRGRGHGYIDLPTARTFDPLFNCTKGFKLMNSSLVTENTRRIVYTDPTHDVEGGYDVEKCSTFDATLSCYIDERYEVHARGECCSIDKHHPRAIFFANDQYYEGTCEADRICSEGRSAAPQAQPCADGYVCDEATSLDSSLDHPCAAGYMCDSATTPDTSLKAPNGQLSRLCTEGHYCERGTGTKEKLPVCPKDFFCPAGTANPRTSQLANDGIIRLLAHSEAHINIHYQSGDDFAVYNDQESKCNAASKSILSTRYDLRIEEHSNVNYIEYKSDQDDVLFAIDEAVGFDMHCSRDKKSAFITNAMRRRECNCGKQFLLLTAIYRLWKCTSTEPLDNIGFADLSSLHGKRDYWYPDSRIHRDYNAAIAMDPSMEIFGLNWGAGKRCEFDESSDAVGLVTGALPVNDDFTLLLDPNGVQLSTRFTYTEKRIFGSYLEMKHDVMKEYSNEHTQLDEGSSSNIDPFIFDLYHSLQLIEQYGEKLEELIVNQPSSALDDYYFDGSVDWCECQSLLKCPNGTVSEQGATDIEACKSTKADVLSRITLLPNSTTALSTSTAEGSVDVSPALVLEAYEVAVLTVDQSDLPKNFTYGEHYQISIYDGCKPCPLRYQCDSHESSCSYPSKDTQLYHINQCLKHNKKMVCIMPDGSYENVETCYSIINAAGQSRAKPLIFAEPDIELCLSRPYSCSSIEWNFHSFRRLCRERLPNGEYSLPYDCADVHRWRVYKEWRDRVCCSSPRAPELRGIDSCITTESICADDQRIEDIIRDKMISVFESEYGYTPPNNEPLGQLIWDSNVQEQNEHDTPLRLFNEWREPFVATKYNDYSELHNNNKPDLSKPWINVDGCCKCKRHPMPHAMDSNAVMTSGFPDDKHKPIQITISALTRVELSVVVELLHGYYYADFIDYFGSSDKSTVTIHTPSRFAENYAETATVLSFIEKSTFEKLHLDLPLNLPINVAYGSKQVEDRFLVDRSNNVTIGDVAFAELFNYSKDKNKLGTNQLIANPIDLIRVDNDWFAHEFWALPYIPFFSNCGGYGSHISWSRLLEDHPDCESVNDADVVPINEFSFRNKRQMNNDMCRGVSLQCIFDEEVNEARENLRWYEVEGSTLFYITRDAVPSSHFLPYNSVDEWGRTHLLRQLRNSYDFIPISVDKEMSGYRHAIPRHVELELKYFQMTRGTKRLVEARLYYDDFCTTEDSRTGSANILNAMNERGIEPCEVDVNGILKSRSYDFEVSFFPLNWFDLLNRFEFRGSVYFLLYTVMGIAITSIGGLVYATNRLLTKLRYPPKFHGLSLIKLVTTPQIKGCALAIMPYMAIMMIIYSCFGTATTTKFGFDNVHSKWANKGLISQTQKLDNSVGRLGSSLLVLGFWIVYRALQKMIPHSLDPIYEDKKEMRESPTNIISKRSHFIAISFCVQAAMLCFLEFSYSERFKDQIHSFVVLFRLCFFAFDLIVSSMVNERLLIAPLLVLIQMTEMLITIGARDFLEFSLTFFIKVAMLVALRLFIYPLMMTIGILWPRWRMLVDQSFSGKGLTRQQKKDRELTWKKVNEDIELRTEGMEPLLYAISVYSIEKIGSILFPFMCIMLMYLYPETEIALQYGINRYELLYYGIFAFYMIPWMSFVDSFVLSSQELLYGWRVYDYFSYQRWRFDNRETRWCLLSQVDESLPSPLQSIDVLCFSSQYYFIMTVLTLGFCTNIFGVTICLRRQYSFLGDPVFPLLVITVIMSCEAVYAVCRYIADLTLDELGWDGVWKVRLLQGTMDDVVAAKLAVGEGRQEDLERERQELLAMNSETFRHTFIEKNRPWVLQHLVELMTPRTLQDQEVAMPDGRPLVDYVRETYSNLMTVGDGVKRIGDRSDISSDSSSDDEFDQRRKWDRTPLFGSSLMIATTWLQKARKRQVFMKAVASLIEKRQEDHCSSCSRTLSSCTSLLAGLSWDGKYDPNAIDCYIQEFESKYSLDESDPGLWIAFFRENASFTTICNICMDGIEQQKLHKNVRHVGAGRPTRPGDISSDDESDDDNICYEPIALVRSSKEGVLLSKWLNACRLKLGGKYPKRDAVRRTNEYLDKLKQKRPNMQVPTRIIHTATSETRFDSVSLSASGARMIKNWLRAAKESSKSRFDARANEIRLELENILSQLDPIDDWFFGSGLRLDGGALKIEGNLITKEKRDLDKTANKQINALKLNMNDRVEHLVRVQQTRRVQLNEQLSEARDESRARAARREVELNRLVDERPSEEEEIRRQHELEVEKEAHSLTSLENSLRKEAEGQISTIQREIESTKRKFEIDTQTIKERNRKEYVSADINWRKNASLYIGMASKKIEQFQREKANSERPMNAKQARTEQRKTVVRSNEGVLAVATKK